MTYESEPNPSLSEILRQQADRARAGGLSDSLDIEGVPTTPGQILELHGLMDPTPEFVHDPEIPTEFEEVLHEAARSFRLTGVWTSVAVEIPNPDNTPREEIVLYIADHVRTHK